mmetsp:Transcript_35655/g.70526  ORF Transcript_35655/g.70526 Transcript_35655/m.70526 type:complete len:227 (-) Transcript_35655:391-1071(-)
MLVELHHVHGCENTHGRIHCGVRGLPPSLIWAPVYQSAQCQFREVGCPRHLQVKATVNRTGTASRMHVGDNEALKSHVLFEDSVEKIIILTGIAPVDLVVRAHYAPSTSLNRCEKRWDIHLPGRTFIHIRVLAIVIRFLVAEGKVLDHSHHARPLDSADICGRHDGPQIRVLASDLVEVAPSPSYTVQTCPRAEHCIRTLALELLADSLCHRLHSVTIKSGRQREK